jgi:hypothetical protein
LDRTLFSWYCQTFLLSDAGQHTFDHFPHSLVTLTLLHAAITNKLWVITVSFCFDNKAHLLDF